MEVSSHDDNSFLLRRRESCVVVNPNIDLIPKWRRKAIQRRSPLYLTRFKLEIKAVDG